jgi:hypothetical protein
LLIFGCCALLFHLSNAPLLPLVGQKLAAAYKDVATAMMSACIIAAQLIMLPIAIAVGRNADRVGRKPILLIGFAVLPLRAVLYTFSDQTWWLIGVQLLDGVGAGIFRRDHAAGDRRPDAWHGQVQHCTGCRRDASGNWRCEQRADRRCHCRPRWVLGRPSHRRGHRVDCSGSAGAADAGDRVVRGAKCVRPVVERSPLRG